ncbi:MAG: site-specific DNA-methyltransferase [Clostridia bacterium]|nr:site-specific DNA-methyltransferase [Clostridia bacterium]
MRRLKMHTPNKVDDNIRRIGELFPNCLTERLDDNGKPEICIDFDMLKQELSSVVVEGNEERYQFTWPDKKKSILLANSPISATLRPCREESVDFDTTQNLYIEGDNLDVLKLLQETYLGKIKMIYIDPPYNTGNDFVYEDDFAESAEEYLARSGQFDAEGNRLVPNTESNGRFHTDWLNMIYPRLKLSKDLLTDDGVIFISIDDNEVENLLKLGKEVFGHENYVATFPWRKRTAKSDVPFGVSQDYEWILVFAKSNDYVARIDGPERQYFETPDYPGKPWRIHDITTQRSAAERPNSNFVMINPKNGDQYPANPLRTWAVTKDTFDQYYSQGKIVFPGDYDFLRISKPAFRYWKEDDIKKAGEMFGMIAASTKLPDDIGMSLDGTKEITELFNGKIFSFPKAVNLIKYFIDISTKGERDAIILDFFSGSATTAHAVMQLNAEDGGNRKFIMVQLPEETDEKSEAYKAGYKNICEIGKERIRRAGRKIKNEYQTGSGFEQLGMDSAHFKEDIMKAGESAVKDPDIGFRVLKLDSSNMKDVYYTPAELTMENLLDSADNIKEERTSEDLLFQVMLELGVELSATIREETIAGKKVFYVAEELDNFLIACFDEDVTDEVITEIAKKKPYYFVTRDHSMASDSVATNFEQIFETYSPATVRKVL